MVSKSLRLAPASSLPRIFREAGYQTFMMGKWRLGRHHVDFFPTGRGFEHFYGFLNAGIDYESHIAQGGLDWQRNGKTVREKGYSTDLLTAEAVKMLKGRDKSKPTFLYLTYNAVHTPLQAPDSALDGYANVSDTAKRTYYAMTSRMDDGIGRVLKTLDEEGMAQDTIVVFVSDNGGARTGDNSPLRGAKTSSFEGGVRVPGALYAPGAIEGGETEQFVTVHDWLPTLAAPVGSSCLGGGYPNGKREINAGRMKPTFRSGLDSPTNPSRYTQCNEIRLSFEVRVAGALLTTLTILDGRTVLSQAVLGGDLGPIAAGVEPTVDLLSVGTMFPGADLAAVVRT